jgi:hypothetical protein
MVCQIAESPTRSYKSAMELIVRIVHLVASEYGFQATLVERLIMSYEG